MHVVDRYSRPIVVGVKCHSLRMAEHSVVNVVICPCVYDLYNIMLAVASD